VLALKLIWRTSRWLTLACLALVVVAGLLPVGYMVATGIVVGAVPEAVRGGLDSPEGRRLLMSLGLLAAIYVTESGVSSIRTAVTASLGSRFVLNLRGEVFDATLGPSGIAHLEDPSTADELRITGGGDARWYAEQLVQNLTMVCTQKLTGIGSAVIVFAFAWWAPLVLAVPIALSYRWINREIDTFINIYVGSTPEMRRGDYLRDLGVRPEAAKELRVFGLARWLVDWYGATWREAMRPQWKARRGHAAPLVHMTVAELIAGAVIFAVLCRAAFTGDISIGELAAFVAALQGMHMLGAEGDNEMSTLRGIKTIGRLIKLQALTAGPSSELHGTRPIDRSGTVRFEDVSFSYPTTTAPVLDGLSLEIPHGRSLAIVGLNGAGKTTLTKLLARLYDPDGGRISVDGVDMRELDPDSWRRRIGVIFQDFIRFEFSARANIGFGAVDLQADTAVLDRVATKAGATSIIGRLPDGWETVLSRGYENGTELSGGEWQRIALGRALMALEGGADILVLDEPTANLDVRAEAELFDRFLDLTAGATTILISHRFSTVRHADRIAVVEHGRVIELGTHDSLLADGGRYAHLFRLQAERFAEPRETTGA
jgi:ATP-binding cassette subfamily B protein